MASTEPELPAGQDDSPDVPLTRKRFIPLGMLFDSRRNQTFILLATDMGTRKQPGGYELVGP